MSRFPVGRKLVGELPWQTQSVASGVFLPRSAIEAAAETISPLRGRGRSAERLGRSAETAEPQDARALEDIGLRNLAHDEDSPAALAARDIPGEFEYHKQIGATSAYFSQTAHMERAIDRLSSDYVFIRDFQMSLPTPIKVDADEGPSTEPPDDASDLAWRDAAGINKAQKDDYTGQGILLGMLDTGIDADHTEFRVGQR